MPLDQDIQGLRLRVMARAEQPGNVSAACRAFGLSRTVSRRFWSPAVERRGRFNR